MSASSYEAHIEEAKRQIRVALFKAAEHVGEAVGVVNGLAKDLDTWIIAPRLKTAVVALVPLLRRVQDSLSGLAGSTGSSGGVARR